MLEQDAPQQQTDSAQADAAKAGDPTAAAPAPAAGAAKSDNPANVLEDKGEAQVVAPADWPEDWREKLSAGDEKLLGQLKRFASPINVATSWRDAHKKLSSGEHKRWSLPDGADDEAIASWRTERGIPAEAAGYLTNLPDGLVIGEADKPSFELFADVFLANNVPEATGKALVKAYFEAQQKVADERWDIDETQRRGAVDELRAELGSEYKGVVNSIVGMLDTASPDVKAAIMDARGPDGGKLFNRADVVRWFADIARELNPLATIVPAGGADIGQSIETELAEITKQMGDGHSAYWKGPKSTTSPGETVMQVRYRELIEAKQKLRR